MAYRIRAVVFSMMVSASAGCASTAAREGAPDPGPAAQVLPALAQQLVNAVPADPAVWQRHMTERGVFVSEGGDVANRAELLEAFGPFPPGLSGSIQVRNPQITEFGDIAIMVFDAHERQTVFDQQIEVNYKITQTWRREDARWQLLATQNLVLAKDPPALPVNRKRLKDYVGVYELAGKRRYRVELRDGALVGGRDQAPDLKPLIPVGDNVFADSGSSLGILRIFVRGPKGAVQGMVERRKFADTHWRRLARTPKTSPPPGAAAGNLPAETVGCAPLRAMA
jgi:hypothetical protein